MKWGTPKDWIKSLGTFLAIDAVGTFIMAMFGSLFGGPRSFLVVWLTCFVAFFVGFVVLISPWVIWLIAIDFIFRKEPERIGKWAAVGGIATFIGWVIYFVPKY
jgi:hypothetical protein